MRRDDSRQGANLAYDMRCALNVLVCMHLRLNIPLNDIC